MASAKLLLLIAITAALLMAASSLPIETLKTVPDSDAISTKEVYRFSIDDPNDSTREETGIILNPGTKQAELVVMGNYTVTYWRTRTKAITVFTADRNGYKARYVITKLPPPVLHYPPPSPAVKPPKPQEPNPISREAFKTLVR